MCAHKIALMKKSRLYVVIFVSILALFINAIFYGQNVDTFVEDDGSYTEIKTTMPHGTSLKGYPKRSYGEQCKKECMSNPDCLGYVFNSHTAECDQKSEILSLSKNTDGMIKTFIKQKPIVDNPNFIFKSNVVPNDDTSHDIVIHKGMESPKECLNICMSPQYVDYCIGFTYDHSTNTCAVKDEMGTLKLAKNVDTYIRQ